MDEQSEDPIALARRYLTDIVVFEGAKFTVPAGGEAVEPPVPAAAEVPQPAAVATATGSEGSADLESFRRQICDCTRCGLGATRNEFVFGAGNPAAGIVFVGEAPGAEEDRRGEPFVGAAGQLLTKIIAAMGLGRGDVYICNILKCRPPNNRDPEPDEIAHCEPYLKRQIEIIQPKVICTLGPFAAQTLLHSGESMGRLRGREHQYEGIPLVATYHPAALLRNPQWKRPTWEDVQMVRALYDGVAL
ncbi:MAG: uracil-DNA glycosylase [Candidatus Latescibacteria bacterium]|jgi:DNA polymerase|nr:uracil-DNA glycosylase [Candidatus Latescibacterota bacterium]